MTPLAPSREQAEQRYATWREHPIEVLQCRRHGCRHPWMAHFEAPNDSESGCVAENCGCPGFQRGPMPYALANDEGIVQRLAEIRTQYATIDYCLHWADVASRGVPVKAWEILAPKLVELLRIYAGDESGTTFARLRAAMTTLDSVLDELPALMEGVRARLEAPR